MKWENVDFNGKCYVHFLIGEYGEVGGMNFTDKDSLSILIGIFKKSHNFNSFFKDGSVPYLTGLVDPEDKEFQKFMLDNIKITKEQDEEFYTINGFYQQSNDFWDVWEDNDIEEVRVSFPLIDDCYALAQYVNHQLSIIVNAFGKNNAKEIIVTAAGEIQSLVQKDCIDRSK